MQTLPILIGLFGALGAGLLFSRSGMDRDRALYPALMMVIAFYYVLFALIGQSPRALLAESAVALAFVVAAVAGFRSNLWWVVLALAAHGLLDLVHGALIDDPGVPAWWPAFCAAYDVAAAAYLGVLVSRGRVQPQCALRHRSVDPPGTTR